MILSQSDIRDIFWRVYKAQVNFMTPNIERYGQIGGYIYELSHGYFGPDHIYGVTVLDANTHERTDLNKGGMSLEKANAYIKTLKDINNE